jgi:hypothetical protein
MNHPARPARLLPLPLVAGVVWGALIGGCRVDPAKPDSAPAADGGASDSGAGGAVGHVVVLVMDGARIDETFGHGQSVTDTVVEGGETERFTCDTESLQPELRARLLPEATVVGRAVATGVTITAEGHAELLTGRRVPLGNFPSDSGPAEYRTEFPNLFELARTQLGDAVGAHHLVVNTVHLEAQRWSIAPGYGEDAGASYTFLSEEGSDTEPVDSDQPVVAQVQALLRDEAPRLIVANLHDMDRAGHYGGPDAYLDDVAAVDGDIAALWEFIQSTPGLADQTVLVLVADHGRHRKDEPLDYKNHNDHCAGCREIPMVLAGPGIRDGVETDALATLSDLGTTLAWLMGMDSPYADGRLLVEVLDAPPPAPHARTGSVAWARTDRLEAWEEQLDEVDRRSEVWVDGALLSSATATHAEAPTLLSTTTELGALDVACWREMTVGSSVQAVDEWKWTGQCRGRVDGGAWSDLRFPTDPVWPFHRAVLAADSGGRVWAAMTNNPNGVTDLGPESGIQLLRWTEAGGWKGEELGNPDLYYATDLDLVVDGTDAWLAFSACMSENHGRYTRSIVIHKIEWSSDARQRWSRVWQTETAHAASFGLGSGGPGTAYGRMERPALRAASDGGLDVAFLGTLPEGGGTTVVRSHSADRSSFQDLEELDSSRRVLPHVSPRWGEDGSLVWARSDASGAAEVCRLGSADSAPTCQAAGGAAVLELAPWGAQTRVTVRGEDGSWSAVDLDW